RGVARPRVPRRVERSARSPGALRSCHRHARRPGPGSARCRGGDRGSGHAPRDSRGRLVKKLWQAREFSTLVILALEIAFFTWWLWPEPGRTHPFFNAPNFLLILKYSSIYGIAAVGAAIVIISGGIDLAPGAVMALAGVVGAQL